MKRNEDDNSSRSNWRTATREEVCQAGPSFRNYSSGRYSSDTNSRRNYGSSADGNRRDATYQNRPRRNMESNWRVREEASSDISYENEFEGTWLFRVEDDEKDSFMEVLEKLHEDNPSLFVKRPYQLRQKKNGLTSILCPTADYRDVNAVRNVAKIIHNVVDHPYGVRYYYKWAPKYFFVKNVLFKTNKNGLSNLRIEEETPVSLTDNVGDISLDEKDDDSSTDLPSNVTDRKCLFYPSESTVENLPSQAGKWMLYGSNDLAKMDALWKKLKPLCDRGVLAALKSSTAGDDRTGVIRAYTKDSENMEEVSSAGHAVMEETGFNEIIYYKTNEASQQGMYNHEGKKDVSLYMHAGNNGFCHRDKFRRWKLWQPKCNEL